MSGIITTVYNNSLFLLLSVESDTWKELTCYKNLSGDRDVERRYSTRHLCGYLQCPKFPNLAVERRSKLSNSKFSLNLESEVNNIIRDYLSFVFRKPHLQKSLSSRSLHFKRTATNLVQKESRKRDRTAEVTTTVKSGTGKKRIGNGDPIYNRDIWASSPKGNQQKETSLFPVGGWCFPSLLTSATPILYL